MKSYLLVFTLCLISAVVMAQQDSCLPFKTGRFFYLDDSSNVVIIKRSQYKQEETEQVSGIKTTFKVKWISDCEYYLTQLWSSNKVKRKQNHAITKVQITKVYNNKYEFLCACYTPGTKVKYGIATKIVEETKP